MDNQILAGMLKRKSSVEKSLEEYHQAAVALKEATKAFDETQRRVDDLRSNMAAIGMALQNLELSREEILAAVKKKREVNNSLSAEEFLLEHLGARLNLQSLHHEETKKTAGESLGSIIFTEGEMLNSIIQAKINEIDDLMEIYARACEEFFQTEGLSVRQASVFSFILSTASHRLRGMVKIAERTR